MRTSVESVQSASHIRIKSGNDIPVKASIPGIPLESILRTDQLRRRPSRPPDYEKENRALVALARALADSPSTILQTLAEKVLEVLHADSAGLSLLTKDEKRFYWAAIAGAWGPHIGGGTPRDFSPCGDVLDRNIPMLFTHWERRYPYLSMAVPLADEGLLVPFWVGGRPVGTIWAIAHNDARKFDAEDLRLLESMGRFASAAYQVVESIEGLKFEIAARERAEAAVREMANGLQAKIRRLIDSNLIGIFIWRDDGQILDANEAYLRIVGYERHDLASGRLNWRELTPAEWRSADERRAAEVAATGTAQPYEKEYVHKSGRRVPVLVGAAAFEKRDEGLGFVVDLTDRKRSEAEARESERRCREAQLELAHANRVATMGQLAASIAHDIKQPLAAAVGSAQAASRWLGSRPPNLEEAQASLDRIIKAAHLADDFVGRVRNLFRNEPPRKDSLDINEAICEIVALTRGEITKNGISLRTRLANDLPRIRADRVQLQQVILNLIMNAVEAMRDVSNAPRELLIASGQSTSWGILVTVHDSGPGLNPEHVDRVFDAFYTTKPGGTGMGLSICRSIIEAHQGRIWASANAPRGAVFQFTLPAHLHRDLTEPSGQKCICQGSHGAEREGVAATRPSEMLYGS
jgi:PAS domain S-box-containing protein